MAKQSLTTIKNWFKTRLKPTQAQYWDTWDSFWHKDETIPTAKIEGLNAAIASKATTESVAVKANRTDFKNTYDIEFTVAGNDVSANTIGFTGSFFDLDGNLVTCIDGLIKTVEAVVVTEGLVLTFDDIVNVPVADVSSVADWNTFFDLPTNGTEFSSVVIEGNAVTLVGGSGITLKDSLFDIAEGTHLIAIEDTTGCVVSIGYNTFGDGANELGCYNLSIVILDSVIDIGEYNFVNTFLLETASFNSMTSMGSLCFMNCNILSIISLQSLLTMGDSCFFNNLSLVNASFSSLLNMGTTVGNNDIFKYINGNIINLTIPVALMTCNGGAPDDDIAYLQANNTVTIITV